MTNHLVINRLDDSDITLQLDEDMSGASGDLDDAEIRRRLMEAICRACNYSLSGHSGIYEDWIPMSVKEHEHKPALTLDEAAGLIRRVWRDKDNQCNEAMMGVAPDGRVSSRRA